MKGEIRRLGFIYLLFLGNNLFEAMQSINEVKIETKQTTKFLLSA